MLPAPAFSSPFCRQYTALSVCNALLCSPKRESPGQNQRDGHPFYIYCGFLPDSTHTILPTLDGSILASGSDDQAVRLWELSTGQCLKVLQGHANLVRSVVFNSLGNLVASGSEDQAIRIWEVGTGDCSRLLQGHTNRVWSVAFSKDDELIAAGSDDPIIYLWEVSTGDCSRLLQGHTNRVWSVAFSPDGKTLASASIDGTIKLWDFRATECLQTLRSDRPYERMNITGVVGLTETQKATLRALGAIEN